MFPIRDDNPTFITPYMTYALILLNVLIWVFIQGLGSTKALALSVCTLGLISGELLQTIPTGTAFKVGPAIACVINDTPSWFTLISHMFLHGGWLHIIGNMWFMWVFADNVEDSMGHFRFFVFYLACGLFAAGLQIAFNPSAIVPMVGASGAIGGVMGAYIMLYPRVKVHLIVFLLIYITTVAVPALWMLGYWFFVQVIGGFSSIGQVGGGVAFWAHVGGFAAGALLIHFFKKPEMVEKHPHYGWKKNN